MQGARALAGDLDVIDMRRVADLELERRIHLVLAGIGADMAFHQHRACALLDHDERADEDRGRLLAGIDEDEMDRPRERDSLRDMDHRAVTHERGIERDRHIVGRHQLAQMGDELLIAGGEPLRHRADREAGFQVGEIGELRHEGAVDEDDRARLDRGEHGDRVLGARLRGRIGHARERLGIAHERAQVGIFPLLDPAVRQPFALEAPERILAQRRDRRRARKRALRHGEIRRQRGFGRSLDRADLDVHRNLTPPRHGIGRSRWLRARAPAPCRRSSRCGPSKGRAPRPARCNRAGAGSA